MRCCFAPCAPLRFLRHQREHPEHPASSKIRVVLVSHLYCNCRWRPSIPIRRQYKYMPLLLFSHYLLLSSGQIFIGVLLLAVGVIPLAVFYVWILWKYLFNDRRERKRIVYRMDNVDVSEPTNGSITDPLMGMFSLSFYLLPFLFCHSIHRRNYISWKNRGQCWSALVLALHSSVPSWSSLSEGEMG